MRSGEVYKARWSEISGGLWRVAGDRMKMHLPHVVPLTPQVKAILARLRELAGGSPYILPAGPLATVRETIHKDALNDALKEMGYKDRQCVHGFRGLFKTAASELGKWRSEAVEMQLAHARGSAVEAAYNDAEYLPERRELMAVVVGPAGHHAEGRRVAGACARGGCRPSRLTQRGEARSRRYAITMPLGYRYPFGAPKWPRSKAFRSGSMSS